MKTDRVLWITGASSGIGEAVARRWVELGGRVALSARRLERLERLALELGGPARARAIACDVTREGAAELTADAIAAAFGRIDAAFANAGFGVSGDFEELTEADFRRQFETNVFGVLRTAKAAFPHLKRSRGAFAVTGSVLGHLSLPGGSPYAMSKFAVRALAQALRGEWARDGVAVTLISPGFVESEIRLLDNEGNPKPDGRDPVPAWLVVPASKAAREIVRAIEARVAERVVTGHGKWIVFLNRLFPGALPRLLSR